jgi:hypothetical protein
MTYQTTEITVNVAGVAQTMKAYYCPKCVGGGRMSDLSAMKAHLDHHRELLGEQTLTCQTCQDAYKPTIVDGVRLPTKKCPKCRVGAKGGRNKAPLALVRGYNTGKRGRPKGKKLRAAVFN